MKIMRQSTGETIRRRIFGVIAEERKQEKEKTKTSLKVFFTLRREEKKVMKYRMRRLTPSYLFFLNFSFSSIMFKM